MDLISLIKENWSVVSQAPWFFLTLAVLFGGGGFAAGRFFLSEKVSNLESRLAFRDEQIKGLEAKLPAHQNEAAIEQESGRHILLGRLTAEYQHSHQNLSRRMLAGLELPPAEWINAELEKLDEPWRVRNIRGRNCEIYEISGGG